MNVAAKYLYKYVSLINKGLVELTYFNFHEFFFHKTNQWDNILFAKLKRIRNNSIPFGTE